MTPHWKQMWQLVALLVVITGTAQAQGLREVRNWSTGGLGLMIAQPVGEFSNFVDMHPGIGGAFALGGPVGLRVGGSLLIYGHQRDFVPIGGGRVLLDLSTDNLIGTLGVGPQITFGRGPVRPYGYGMIGFSYFATVSSLGDRCGCDSFASSTNYDDVTLAGEAGGGLQFALSRHRPLFLDLSARYLRNGRVRYLPEGGVIEHSDRSVTLQAVESNANLVVFQLGLSVGLR
jgi:hypothetical protein